MTEQEKKKPLVILTGPTAAGKTDTSVMLAKEIGGEIISADSVQVYRHMDIGSAKITREEMQGVPHFLIDVLEPDEDFNVVSFQQLALQAMQEIYQRGHIPIVTGGTGFYIQALLYGIEFDETETDKSLRGELEEYARVHGAASLHKRLAAVDREAAEAIHPHNVKRVIRALEYYEQTGNRISRHNEEQKRKESPYRFAYFVLNRERSALYERIDRRVDNMFAQGLVAEVQRLLDMGYQRNLVSMQGLSYKEVAACLEGELTLEEAKDIIKRDTRHFAKRQLTWFKREPEAEWIMLEKYADAGQAAAYLKERLKEKGIIGAQNGE